jgi:hypothetical protein
VRLEEQRNPAPCRWFALRARPLEPEVHARQIHRLNIGTFRQLGDSHTSFHFEPKRELWFEANDRSVILCRLSSNTSPQFSPSGEMWEFGASGELVDGHDNGWVTMD